VTYFDAFDVGDGIVGAGRAVEGNSEIAGARFGLSAKTGGEKSESQSNSGLADLREHGASPGIEAGKYKGWAVAVLRPQPFRHNMLQDAVYIQIQLRE
jgi:hypothetical protein